METLTLILGHRVVSMDIWGHCSWSTWKSSELKWIADGCRVCPNAFRPALSSRYRVVICCHQLPNTMISHLYWYISVHLHLCFTKNAQRFFPMRFLGFSTVSSWGSRSSDPTRASSQWGGLYLETIQTDPPYPSHLWGSAIVSPGSNGWSATRNRGDDAKIGLRLKPLVEDVR